MMRLNEKLAKWAGLCFHEWEVVDDTTAFPYLRCRKCLYCGLEFSTDTDEWELPKCANGEVYFDESLDACFKWLVPKITELHYQTNLKNVKYGWNVMLYNGEKPDRIEALSPDPAPALCLAIEKLIDEKK